MADRLGSLADPSTYDDDPYAALQAYAGGLPPDQPAPGDTHQPYVNPIARGSMTDVLTGLGGGERYQTFPERLVRDFAGYAGGAQDEATRMANPGAYTQSSDVTPEDRLVAQTLPAVATLGAGAPAMAERGALGAFGGRMGSLADTAAYKAPGEVGAAAPSAYQMIKDKAIEQGYAPPNKRLQAGIVNPQRMFAPGIYKDPREIAAEAAAQLEPEHPALQQLFGVTRQDLADIGQQGTRPGNMAPQYAQAANPRTSYVGQGIMTPRNAQRIMDVLDETQKASPELAQGMKSWYVMDPAYQRMEQLVGPEAAVPQYRQFNTLGSMASPGSDVMTEINRGTAANMMATRGQFPAFQRHGGTAEANRGADFPEALRDVAGHAYHSTAQSGPMGRYLESGTVDMTSPKVPLYMQASGVPQTGFQTTLPVPDAHFTRAIGAADVRTTAKPGVSMKGPEYGQVGPWFRESVATPMGMQAVPAQGFTWGAFAPQTGVDTAIGAPKLELLARSIWERAQKLGVDPRVLRDKVLMGQEHAVGLGTLGAGAAAAASQYGQDEPQPYFQ
jgi:hypothetical protein